MPWTYDILHPRIKASSSKDTPLYLWTYQWGKYQLTSTWSISKYIHQKLPKRATKNALETGLKLTDGEALTHKSSRKPGYSSFENAFYNWWQPSYHVSKHVQWQCRSVWLNLQKEKAACLNFSFVFGWILFALLLLIFFVTVWGSDICLFFGFFCVLVFLKDIHYLYWLLHLSPYWIKWLFLLIQKWFPTLLSSNQFLCSGVVSHSSGPRTSCKTITLECPTWAA